MQLTGIGNADGNTLIRWAHAHICLELRFKEIVGGLLLSLPSLAFNGKFKSIQKRKSILCPFLGRV